MFIIACIIGMINDITLNNLWKTRNAFGSLSGASSDKRSSDL